MQPYLVFQNREIASGPRTLAYLRNAGVGNVDVSGQCSAISGSFYSPSSDPAPWYTSSRTDSAAFLGLYLDKIEIAPRYSRSTKQFARGGQSLGRLIVKGASIVASGAMYGRSEAGMEYGSAWLARALAGNCADPCELGTLCLLPACPDSGPALWRRMFGCGLVDGPLISPVSGANGCIVRSVSFTLGSESGYLFADPVTLLSQGLPVATTVCGIASTTQWIGDSTIRITIGTGGPGWVKGVSISAAPLRSNETCPSPSAPEVSFTVAQIPPGTNLVIDGSRRSVEVRENASGRLVGGMDVIATGGTPLEWIDIGPCARACICVRAAAVNAGTTVKIESIDREL
jgi:hypothetical protein